MMRLLLDTHIYIWSVSEDRMLPQNFGRLIAHADEVFVSTATIWEMSIKAARGKLDPRALLAMDELETLPFNVLPVLLMHARAVRDMPDLHRDPFDRLLVAQAITEDLRLLTVDRELGQYFGATALPA
jgi:PIN domain nuclease of toxin-antitoxin system